MDFTAFHVNVSFINEEDGVPYFRAFKIIIEASLGLLRLSTDITYRQREERTLGIFGNAFWSCQYDSSAKVG